MALADIINKIEADARAEAESIIGAAEKDAASVVDKATEQAESAKAAALDAAEESAAREAARVVASAKLESRDTGLRRRRELLEDVLARSVEALAGMPDDAYAAYLARQIADSASGGETLKVGSADAGRKDAIEKALAQIAPQLAVVFSADVAPFERGVLLEGDRVRAELSLEALTAERRDDLEIIAASVLFAEGA